MQHNWGSKTWQAYWKHPIFNLPVYPFKELREWSQGPKLDFSMHLAKLVACKPIDVREWIFPKESCSLLGRGKVPNNLKVVWTKVMNNTYNSCIKHAIMISLAKC
jgi:hypothetical protein